MSEASEAGDSDRRATEAPQAGAKPKIGDTMPVPNTPPPTARPPEDKPSGESKPKSRNRNRNRNRGNQANKGSDGNQENRNQQNGSSETNPRQRAQSKDDDARKLTGQAGAEREAQNRNDGGDNPNKRRRRRRNNKSKSGASKPVEQIVAERPVELDESQLKSRRGKSRKGRPIGRYMMVVSKRDDATHIAILEGRNLIEYYVSRPSDGVFQIHGNIYMGKVQNVLPGMEAAFVDIGTPKNAVLYRGDVQYEKKDFEKSNGNPKIEQLLKPKQAVLCQVTKNPIAHKGARLTTEVSLPGRFVVLVPNSDTYGISKRLPDNERKRLRKILDKARPKGHGLIVRTAAENVTAEEIERDIAGLADQWKQIEALAAKTQRASLLYREPDMSTRLIREEFNKEYRAVVIDDKELYDEVAGYVGVITPALADRVEFYDSQEESLPVFERYHVHEQLHKALDRKVWLPSGGSLIIEHTEALTVIDVNTGKNVGSSSLEETVFRNNLEAAEGVAHQLRLRDIGGIIVIDFVDMEDKKNRDEVLRTFRKALSRDKTRTQVFEIGELGLAEMTRKRIGEGLLESLSSTCPHCEGKGHTVDESVLS